MGSNSTQMGRGNVSLMIGFAWLLALVILFGNLDGGPLTDIDEGAFSEATREMLARGDYISPWLLDAPRFDKPVLIHWLQMACMSVFGVTTLGARIPSAIAGVIWIGAIAGLAFLVSRKLWPSQDARSAYFCGLVISATTIGIPAMSRAATADALLNALLAASLFCIWKYFDIGHSKNASGAGRAWGRLAAVFIGLGLLTKGPVAILIPGAASLFAGLGGVLDRSLGSSLARWLRLITDPISWLIAFAICAPWYWLQYQAQGMAFIEGFFGIHNIGRFTGTMHGFSAGPWYYPAWILIATLPWAPLVARTLVAGFKDGLLFKKELAMLWGVFLFVLVFFSFSATKLPHYGFYGLPGLIVIMALVVSKTGSSLPKKSPWSALLSERLFMVVLLAGLAALPVWWPMLEGSMRDLYYQTVWNVAAAVFTQHLLWFALPLVAALYVLVARPVHGLWVGATVFTLMVHVVIAPTVMHALRDPIQQAARVIQERNLDRVITWRLASPSLSFHAQRIIKSAEPEKDNVIVMHTKDMQALEKLLNGTLGAATSIEVLWAKDGIQIVRVF